MMHEREREGERERERESPCKQKLPSLGNSNFPGLGREGGRKQ